MQVDQAIATQRSVYSGETYFFCSAGCRTKFEAEPKRYLKSQPASASAVPEGAIYTCPMHPQMRQVGPGNCPICGMALEPEIVTAEDTPNSELADMTRRFWIALVLTVPVFVWKWGARARPPVHAEPGLVQLDPVRLGHSRRPLGRLAVPCPGLGLAAGAQPQHVHSDRHGRRGVLALQPRRGAGAWGLPRGFPSKRRFGPGLFRGSAVITVLVLLGQVLELRARERTSGAIKALLNLAPKTARRIREDGSDEEVSLEVVSVGDRLRVRPGEKVPVDGELVEGRVSVDESLVTGESMPVTKEPGAKVVAGALNKTGSL